jgi:hypothetical protein
MLKMQVICTAMKNRRMLTFRTVTLCFWMISMPTLPLAQNGVSISIKNTILSFDGYCVVDVHKQSKQSAVPGTYMLAIAINTFWNTPNMDGAWLGNDKKRTGRREILDEGHGATGIGKVQ